MYKAIITVNGEMSKVVQGNTPAQLGTAIGSMLPNDALGTEVDVVFEVTGPISRRIASEIIA